MNSNKILLKYFLEKGVQWGAFKRTGPKNSGRFSTISWTAHMWITLLSEKTMTVLFISALDDAIVRHIGESRKIKLLEILEFLQILIEKFQLKFY